MKEKRVFPKKNKSVSQKNILDDEIQQLRSQYEVLTCDKTSIKRFQDFPLSRKTLKGLSDAKFTQPTDIQRESIGPALLGKDVLGAAITGSGKTLAFLIPVLEHLFIAKWTRTDGIAAVIISPTRELAYQIFETLKKIGKYHDFSAGLIIGGKNLKFERSRMDQCSILICTPGRLLQHMDENPLFNASTMEVLVLDEADRCLDMGFEQTLNAIVENFPPERQTLLFSATQTSSVKDLVRLNLKNPVYIGTPMTTKETGDGSTSKLVPDLLQQNYVVIALEDKITMLWSFIKNHLKQKVIVFLSSCKQVKFIYEIFCKLRPGTSLLALYGTLHQDRRIAIYNDFVKKSNVVLFATDIASRGLDFPSVNWVVQLDCPEDVTQYIHRAGRSARNKTRGESLLVMMPSEEEGMIDELNRKCISVRRIQIDPKKLFSPRAKIEAYLAQNQELKASAQRAFVAYIKSVFLMKNKKVFNVLSLDFDAYAKSLGLVVTPRVRFLERFLKKQNQNDNQIDSDTENSEDEIKPKSRPENDSTASSLFHAPESSSESDDDDFIKIKRVNHDIKGGLQSSEDVDDLPPPVLRKKDKLVTKASLAKKALKKNLQVNEKLKFDDEGREIADPRKQLQSELAKLYENKVDAMGGIDIQMAKQLLQEEDKFDKQRFRSLVKQKHKKTKEKLKKKDGDEDHGGFSDDAEEADNDFGESDGSVDLSWLPHPSNVYKNKSNSEEDSDMEKSFDPKPNVSRKSQFRDESIADGGVDTSDDDDDFAEPVKKKPNVTSKLTLGDAEVIAAQLLANSL